MTGSECGQKMFLWLELIVWVMVTHIWRVRIGRKTTLAWVKGTIFWFAFYVLWRTCQMEAAGGDSAVC
jgi:hypothetical protein